MNDKQYLHIPHPEMLTMYLTSNGIMMHTEFTKVFYEEVLHLGPSRIYDTVGDDFRALLEDKTYRLALQKTPLGLVECEKVIKTTLDVLLQYIPISRITDYIHIIDIKDTLINLELETINLELEKT